MCLRRCRMMAVVSQCTLEHQVHTTHTDKSMHVVHILANIAYKVLIYELYSSNCCQNRQFHQYDNHIFIWFIHWYLIQTLFVGMWNVIAILNNGVNTNGVVLKAVGKHSLETDIYSECIYIYPFRCRVMFIFCFVGYFLHRRHSFTFTNYNSNDNKYCNAKAFNRDYSIHSVDVAQFSICSMDIFGKLWRMQIWHRHNSVYRTFHVAYMYAHIY